MPRFGRQKSLVNNQDLRAKSIRRFLSDSRPPISATRGFTLIELLVVIAVIGILSVVVLAGYNGFGARQEVKNAAAELKSELRKYQTLAIAGQKKPNPSDSNCQDNGTLSDYSIIIFKPANYHLYLFCAPVPVLDLNPSKKPPWTSQVEIVEVGYFDTALKPCLWLWLKFKPINNQPSLLCGFTELKNFPTNPDRVYITLSDPDNSTTYRVFVTYTGEIYEEKL